jgi:hypothetical protein
VPMRDSMNNQSKTRNRIRTSSRRSTRRCSSPCMRSTDTRRGNGAVIEFKLTTLLARHKQRPDGYPGLDQPRYTLPDNTATP